MDVAKLAAGAVLVAAGVVGFYLLGSQPIWLRWILVLAGVVLGTLVGLQSHQGKTFWSFVQSARVELRKVVWPTRQETNRMMMVVILAVLAFSLIMAAFDFIIQFAVKWLLGS